MYNIKKASLTAVKRIIITTIVLVILIPIFFVTSMSFMSSREVFKFPLKTFPQFTYELKAEKLDDKVAFSLKEDNKYHKLIISNDSKEVRQYLLTQLSTKISKEKLKDIIEKSLSTNEPISFTGSKSILYNYKMFFVVSGSAGKALITSIKVVFLTILISLVIGGMAGYGFARYVFIGKDPIKIGILFVRMFPAVSIAIPMVMILASMGLYDKPGGLALVYSVGNIALTIWITCSIFLSIPVDLEEAAYAFGISKIRTFFKITLPLAIPGLAACSMYGFLAAWNETVSALILTQNNPTFAVVVYQSIFGSQSNFGFAAAGGIIMAIPAVIFTFVIKKYINQMWGGSSI